jgi:ADP-ribose pyrophosphatase
MTLESTERVYSGRVVNLDLDTVRFPNGSTGKLEMVRHPGASAVVPMLDEPRSADPRVILIRQFRHAADGHIWEIPAGRLDEGETPATCAQRELEEEIGMTADVLSRLTTIFTTPGFTDEKIHIFLALDLKPGKQRRDNDEFMEVETKRWSQVMGMIRSGDIKDAKSIVGLLYVECFRRKASY